jgi:hypothetical protein
MSLKLFGCSFTNWIYPTWADFVKLHYEIDVEIYGRPAIGNDVLKRLIFTKTTKNDHVIVMFAGNDRLDHGILIKIKCHTIWRTNIGAIVLPSEIKFLCR